MSSKGKNRETVAYSVFTDAMKHLNLSQTELARAIGYGDTAPIKWKTSGEMPKVAGLACEALLRRARIEVDSRKCFIVAVKASEIEIFKKTSTAFGWVTTSIP